MKRICIYALLLLVAMSCSEKKYFEIRGDIEGIGAQTVTLLYYGNGGMQRVSVAAEEGKFIIGGVSEIPTLAYLMLGDGRVMATLVTRDGESIKLRGDIASPDKITVKGSPLSEQIAKWRSENSVALESGDAKGINEAVARFVGSHKGSLASSALMVTTYITPGYELEADSLMRLISADAKTGPIVHNFNAVLATQLNGRTLGAIKAMILPTSADSSYYYLPSAHRRSLLAFVPEDRGARDSIIAMLRAVRNERGVKDVDVIEFVMAADSMSWRRATERDSAKWIQTWAPGMVSGGAVRGMGIPSLPYFIVCDSAGAQLVRTRSMSIAQKAIK